VRPDAEGIVRNASQRSRQRAVVVGLEMPDGPRTAEPPLAELKRLAATAGAEVVGEVTQRRPRPDAAYFIGRGKARECASLAAASGADVVLFDNDLSPAQERNLEEEIGKSVVDRSRLILDIFATRARSKQAALQVELAQLEYQKPRLKRMWTHLERMEGAIGTRGPGEKQIEEDKRIIGKRIAGLKKQLETVERQRESRSRSRREYFKVSLVGYTNAGKSTLLERLTGADAFIEDKLFATLDTQTRAWKLPGRVKVFLSDTVGFIRDLPHHLVASFQSTLAEAVDADLLLHVVDASNPDAALQMQVVDETLDAIGAGGNARLVVFNKLDVVRDRLIAQSLVAAHPGAVGVSARKGAGVAELEARVAGIVQTGHVALDLEVPAGAGRLLAYIEDRATVLERRYDGDVVFLRIRTSPRDAARIDEDLRAATRPR
jgi:GTP-binding protein HflX